MKRRRPGRSAGAVLAMTPAGSPACGTAAQTSAVRSGLFLAALLAMPAGHGPAVAQEAVRQPPDWSFGITPYVWFAALDGDVATLPSLPAAKVDASFGDIIENTDLAAMIAAEFRYGRWALLADLTYLGLSADGSTPGPFFGDVDADVDTLFVSLGGAYRVVNHGRFEVDAVAGARLWHVETKLDIDAGVLPGRRVEDGEFWADPILGLRGHVDLGRGFFLQNYADIGGFGAGSDLTWQILSTLGYELRDWVSIRAGYRHMHVDYEDDGFVFDVDMSGPIIGATFRF